MAQLAVFPQQSRVSKMKFTVPWHLFALLDSKIVQNTRCHLQHLAVNFIL